jgi:alkylhydroperoxidase family enzyme
MRLPYTPNPPPTHNDEEKAILNRVITRRGAGGLIALDLTFLYAPLIADGFKPFMASLRTRNGLPADLRETALCRVAVLTGAWYEWDIHAPIALAAGLSTEGLATLMKGKEVKEGAGGDGGLTDMQWVVLRYADAMILDASVPSDIFEDGRMVFGDKEIVELTASIAGFNTVARFVRALDVGEKNDGPTFDGTKD